MDIYIKRYLKWIGMILMAVVLLYGSALTVCRASAAGSDPVAEIKPASVTLRVGQTRKLTLSGIGKDKLKWWSVKNSRLATIDQNGKVRGLAAGKTKILLITEEKVLYSTLNVKNAKFRPVKMKKMANYSSLKRNLSGKELQKAYNKAKKLVRPLAGLSRKEKLEGVAAKLRHLFDTKIKYSMKSTHHNDAYGYFVNHKASCAGCAQATGLCLNILGIKFQHVNRDKYKHQWARVKMEKEYWICDAYALYTGPEIKKKGHPGMLNYKNPVMVFAVGKTNVAAKFKKYDGAYYSWHIEEEDRSTWKKRISIKPKKGWKIEGIWKVFEAPDGLDYKTAIRNGSLVDGRNCKGIRVKAINKREGRLANLELFF